MPSRAGSPNRNKRGLLARLQREFPDYHPVVEMARIANDPDADIQLRAQMHSNVAKFVTPQMKAIEITGEDGGPIVTRIIPDEELLKGVSDS